MHKNPANLSSVLLALIENDPETKGNQTHFSRLTGVNQPTINRIISGQTREPKLKITQPIIDRYNISLDQLYGKEPIPDIRHLIEYSAPLERLSASDKKGPGFDNSNWHNPEEKIDKIQMLIKRKLEIDIDYYDFIVDVVGLSKSSTESLILLVKQLKKIPYDK